MEKMKDSREVLVKFMQGKADKLSEYGIDSKKYFNEDDKDDIMSWELDVADKVVAEISKSINYGSFGLVRNVCPFCLRFVDSCFPCGYGIRHGVACGGVSDFRYINDFFNERDLWLFNILDKDFYKRLWTSSNCEWG